MNDPFALIYAILGRLDALGDDSWPLAIFAGDSAAPCCMRPAMKKWALFSCIEELHGEAGFGRVLDAGTGPRSLGWLASLDTDSITAVTGAASMARQVERHAAGWNRAQDRLIVGNWSDPDLLAGEQFDTVLADYLLGSIEGFAPYFQESLFERLRPMTAKRFYLTGAEPYVARRPATEAGVLVWSIGRYRDACLLLLGKQPYREFPLDWVVARLSRSGFDPIATRKFPAAFSADFVNREIATCRRGLERMADRALGEALIAHGDAIRARALEHIAAHGALRHGFSYVVAAEPT